MQEQRVKCLYITFNGLMDPLGQSQVLPYIKDLSKAGIKFYLISLEKAGDLRKIKELREQLNGLQISWYKLKYFKDIPLAMIFNISQCFFVSFYLLIFKRIKIIHARAYLPLFSVLLLKKIFRTKLLFDMRGFWPEELVDSNRIKKNSFYYKTIKFLERKSILSSDWIVVLTLEAKEIIENEYNQINLKIIWMPACVNENMFELKEHVCFSDKFVLVYSGSLWSYYNMPAMADFFNVLKSEIYNAHFLVLGNNETERLHQLFLEKGIEKDDYTILSLNPKDVAKYLLGSNLAISFIYDTYSKKASFPTKIAEYLMTGLPLVINVQSAFLKKLVSSNKVGVVIDKFDQKSYGAAVENLKVLLKDKKIKEKCRAVAKRYLSKKVCVDKYLEIYQKIG